MTEFADPGEVESASAGWTEGQLRCRAYGSHAWEPWTVHTERGEYVVTQHCIRCENLREQRLDYRGYPVTGWKVQYEEGYLLPKGTGRIDSEGRALLRLRDLRSMGVRRVRRPRGYEED